MAYFPFSTFEICFATVSALPPMPVRKRDRGASRGGATLSDVPREVLPRTVARKVLRALVFCACAAGFTYQAREFMNMYWEYKTVLDMQVEYPRKVELPSMTICNYNGLPISKVCAESSPFRRWCTPAPEEMTEICACVPRVCRDGKPTDKPYILWPIARNISYRSYHEYKKYLQTKEEFITDCKLQFSEDGVPEKECDPYFKSIRAPSDETEYMNVCFTINTLLGRQNASQPEILAKASQIVDLNPMPEEYPEYLLKVFSHVSFHQPRTVLNPYRYGYNLELRGVTKFRLKKVVKRLLPPPYETNCMDYVELWKARGGYGPANVKECIEECQKNASMTVHGCIIQDYQHVVGNGVRCESKRQLDATQPMKLARECEEKHCRPACEEITYEARREVSGDSALQFSVSNGSRDPSFANMVLIVDMDGMETTTYTYSPKLQENEILSYLGGYLGIWLGISLMAVFDVFEGALDLPLYPCRGRRKIRVEHPRELGNRSAQKTPRD